MIGNEYTVNKPVCPHCKSLMDLDDYDVRFRGNQDNYWVCPNCNSSAIEKIRYGKSINIEFHDYSEY